MRFVSVARGMWQSRPLRQAALYGTLAVPMSLLPNVAFSSFQQWQNQRECARIEQAFPMPQMDVVQQAFRYHMNDEKSALSYLARLHQAAYKRALDVLHGPEQTYHKLLEDAHKYLWGTLVMATVTAYTVGGYAIVRCGAFQSSLRRHVTMMGAVTMPCAMVTWECARHTLFSDFTSSRWPMWKAPLFVAQRWSAFPSSSYKQTYETIYRSLHTRTVLQNVVSKHTTFRPRLTEEDHWEDSPSFY